MRDAYVAAAGVVGIVVVAALAAVFSMPVACGIIAVGLAAVAAIRFPAAAVGVAVATVALVPIYWLPDIPLTHVGVPPIVIACVALTPMALRNRAAIRLGAIDKLVITYVLLSAASYLINAEGALGSIAATLTGVALPYAAFRLIGARAGASSAAAVGAVVAGVVSAVIAVREYDGWPNPYFPHFGGGHAHAFFARSDVRLHHVRPEAAFGHSIALGMFLVLAAVLALGLSWRSTTRKSRPLLYGATLVILWGLSDNLVRGPLLMLAFAVVVLLFSESRRGRYGRGLLVAAALVVLVNIGSFANVFQLRDASFQQGGAVQASGEYRVEIWRVVSDSSNFSLIGNTAVDTDGIGFVAAQGQAVGLKSFDNAYALIYIGFGALTLLVFIGIGIRVAQAALGTDLAVVDSAWAAAILAAFINLMTVNLLTQFAHIFWLAIGLIATAVQMAGQRAADPKLAVEPVARSAR